MMARAIYISPGNKKRRVIMDSSHVEETMDSHSSRHHSLKFCIAKPRFDNGVRTQSTEYGVAV